MKILIVGISWPPETFIERLVKGLCKQGFSVTIGSTRKPGTNWFQYQGFAWLNTPSWNIFPMLRYLSFIWRLFTSIILNTGDLRLFIKGAKRYSKNGEIIKTLYFLLPFCGKRFDVIYFPWNSAAITYLPLYDLGIPVVVSCRGSQINIAPHNPNRIAIRQGLKTTFAKAAAIHCVCHAIKSEAMQYGLEEKKAHVIPAGVDHGLFQPDLTQNPSRDKFTIVSIGSLIWSKGYEYSLKAIHDLKKATIPVQFEIFGEGTDRQRILYTIHDLDLQNIVVLHGKKTTTEIRDRLCSAHVFLLSSLSEGISNAVLEAMACCLPVVTTDCGGMREAVTNEQEGFVVPVRDTEAITDALGKIWHNPEMAGEMGKAGRKRVVSDFNLSDQVDSFASLFSSLGEG